MAITARKHKSDLVILFSTLLLMVIGLIVIYAIGPMRANVLNSTYGSNYSSDYFFIHQLISVSLAVLAFFAAFKWVPYDFLRKYSKVALIGGLLLSTVLWIASMTGSSLATCELGQCRWLNVGISIQPSEVLKIGLILYLAEFMSRKKEEGTVGDIKEFWLPLVIVCGISLIFVVVIQGDLGTGVSMLAIILGMLLVGGVPLKQLLLTLCVIAVAGVGAITLSSHRMERVNAWWDMLTGGESSDSTYHVENAMLAIGTGGLFGVGIGNSVQATGYLPESINDSVFAIMGETFGFVGLMFIVCIFAVMLFRMLRIADGTTDLNNKLVVIGVFAWVASQVVVNIAAMTCLAPATGITLPLMSYGGTSMLFIAFGIGLTLHFSCYTGREVKEDENTSSGRGIRGSYNSSRRRRS